MSLYSLKNDLDNSEEAQPEDEGEGISFMFSSLFACVLEDTITELRILAECNNELRISKAESDMGLLLALKFGVEQPPAQDELAGVRPHQLGTNDHKLAKLEADRKLMLSTMVETYKELTVRRSYAALAAQNERFERVDAYRFLLQEEEARNRLLRRELNKQVRQQRNHIKSVLYDTEATIDDLKTQVEDALLYSECRSRYADNWQRARSEQHEQTIHDKEKGPSRSIEYYKQRFDHEQRVHAEVEVLINIAINETLEKVEQQMVKYDQDMEAMDLKIQIKKNDYQDMYDKRVGLEETIAKHDELMKMWVTFKDEREKARLYREKMTNSAIIVQAWWRGLLVRRQLGPYKVSKKKAAAEAAKKKK